MPLPLETKRLVIRSFTTQDAPALHERVFGDDEVMRFIPRGASPSVERTRGAVERFTRHERENGFALWAQQIAEAGDALRVEHAPEHVPVRAERRLTDRGR